MWHGRIRFIFSVTCSIVDERFRSITQVSNSWFYPLCFLASFDRRISIKCILPGKYMFVEYSWNIPMIYSRNIPKTFTVKFRGIFPEECSGNIECRNIPWMFHGYPTNVTCTFLGGSRNTMVDEVVPHIRWVSLKILYFHESLIR